MVKRSSYCSRSRCGAGDEKKMRSNWRSVFDNPPLAPQRTHTPVFSPIVRVLVVDDEPSICKALTMALDRAGYAAVSAQSGESALAILRDEHIDVMLIDLRIPDMRGDVVFEVAAG